MDYKKKESEGAKNGGENEDEYVHTILFAAGTALTMACLKRVMMLFFVEQWRMRVFLVLNLVLLAILFSSIRSTSSTENQDSNANVEVKIDEKKKRRKQCGWCPKFEACKECHKLSKVNDANEVKQEEFEVDNEPPKLSKEELNERVEAFIAMFRQHLVSDARKGRNKFHPRPKQTENFNLQKGSNLTRSSK